MDVIQRSAVGECKRSPLNELNRPPTDFKEECEVLIASSNTPILQAPQYTGTNFVEQNPQSRLDAVNALDWSVFGNPVPYVRQVTTYEIDSGAGFGNYKIIGIENVNGVKFQGTNNPIGGPSTIFPSSPGLVEAGPFWFAWEDAVIQYAIWEYNPNIQPKIVNNVIQGYYWLNSIYTHRSRWRANKTVSGFTAQAQLYSAQLVGNSWTGQNYPDGVISNRFILLANNAQDFTLPANTWQELPKPSLVALPNRSIALIGAIWFSVHSETQASWSARTGVRIS